MTVEELRIGNLLRDKVSKTELKVVELTEKDIITYVIDREMFPLKDGWGIEPIPLTEEWLVKFGFEKGSYKECDETHYVNNKHTIKVIISGIGYWDVYTDYNPFFEKNNGLNAITDNRGLKYVHQLQNLYHALTGEELTIKK